METLVKCCLSKKICAQKEMVKSILILLAGVTILVYVCRDHDILGMTWLSILAAADMFSGVTQDISWGCERRSVSVQTQSRKGLFEPEGD